MKLAQEHSLFVIEDNAQAIGADYFFSDGTTKKAGSMGHIGCTSFFPAKNLGCYGDGGAIFTDDDELAHKMRVIVNHGMEVRYYHDSIGVNSRLDSIQAAILRIKLKHLNSYTKARQQAAAFYDRAFADNPGLTIPVHSKFSNHVFHQYTLKTNGIDRFKLQEYLMSKDIPAMIYYPVALHMQKAYIDSRYKNGDFPVTEDLCNRVISLPMHTELEDRQLEYITFTVNDYCS